MVLYTYYLCSDLSVEDEVSDEHWWRGCKMRDSIGCSEHKWLHHDHEYLVDECVCDTELCNKDMQPIPSSTTVKTSTPSGNTFFLFNQIVTLYLEFMLILYLCIKIEMSVFVL